MDESISRWESFTATLAEARRAAAEGRSADLMTLAAQLGQSAATMSAPSVEQVPAIRQELAAVTGVLTHVSRVHGALNDIRTDHYGPGAPGTGVPRRSFDQRA